jgi:hypothetical protein
VQATKEEEEEASVFVVFFGRILSPVFLVI